jgi:molecular chaperone HtpG
VFSGTFTLDAAQRIADASLPVLSNLMDKSLLQGDASRGFNLHPLWKQFGGGKLAENPGENELVLGLHRDYYLDFLRQHDIELRIGTQKTKTLEELETQIDNVHSAVARTGPLGGTPALNQGVEMLKRFYDYQGEVQAMRAYREVFRAEEGHPEGVGQDASSNEAENQPIPFKPETHQLLEILSNSYYTDREVFLRELIANAAQALTRVESELLAKHEVLTSETPLIIRISADPDAKTLTIMDTGIGMTAEELGEKLGIKLYAGERAFVEVTKSGGGDLLEDMIGQFGAGFYSAYLVAESIRVESRSALPDAQGAVWASPDTSTFSIAPLEKKERGTRIILKLRPDASEFLLDQRLRELIRKYSNFIPFPIFLGDSGPQVNSPTLLWRRNPEDVIKQDYVDFYKQFTLDLDAPLTHDHVVLDSPMQVHAILYVPCHAQRGPFSLRKEDGLKLYSGKVLIQEYCKDLLPDYFRFVEGVVDAEDLPLNVSREALQSNRLMINLKKTLTGKIVEMLKRLAFTDGEAYTRLWLEYGRYIMEGAATEHEDTESLYPLLRFRTIDRLDKWTSLQDYVQQMKPEQPAIYYILSDNNQALMHSPYLDALRKPGYNALVFTDQDGLIVSERLDAYLKFPLVNVVEAGLGLTGGEEDTARAAAQSILWDSFAPLVARVRTVLCDRVQDVHLNDALGNSPARLLDAPDNSRAGRLETTLLLDGDEALKKVLELNPLHMILVQLNSLPADNPLTSLIIEQIYENARLAASIEQIRAS